MVACRNEVPRIVDIVSIELSIRQLTAAASRLQVRIDPTIEEHGVVIDERDAAALVRTVQQKDDRSLDGNTARRLLRLDRPLTERETVQLAQALDRVVQSAHRADQLRRGIIPGALSSREVTDLYRRGFVR